jgi:hypothetical protein
MPRTTKVQTQSDLIYTAEELMAASFVLEDDPETDQLLLFEDTGGKHRGRGFMAEDRHLP